jgi:hypothetical protein
MLRKPTPEIHASGIEVVHLCKKPYYPDEIFHSHIVLAIFLLLDWSSIAFREWEEVQLLIPGVHMLEVSSISPYHSFILLTKEPCTELIREYNS